MLTDIVVTYIITVFRNFTHVSLDERLDQSFHTHQKKRLPSLCDFLLTRNSSPGQVKEGLLIMLEITTRQKRKKRMLGAW